MRRHLRQKSQCILCTVANTLAAQSSGTDAQSGLIRLVPPILNIKLRIQKNPDAITLILLQKHRIFPGVIPISDTGNQQSGN
jgi:hypothetical protein